MQQQQQPSQSEIMEIISDSLILSCFSGMFFIRSQAPILPNHFSAGLNHAWFGFAAATMIISFLTAALHLMNMYAFGYPEWNRNANQKYRFSFACKFFSTLLLFLGLAFSSLQLTSYFPLIMVGSVSLFTASNLLPQLTVYFQGNRPTVLIVHCLLALFFLMEIIASLVMYIPFNRFLNISPNCASWLLILGGCASIVSIVGLFEKFHLEKTIPIPGGNRMEEEIPLAQL